MDWLDYQILVQGWDEIWNDFKVSFHMSQSFPRSSKQMISYRFDTLHTTDWSEICDEGIESYANYSWTGIVDDHVDKTLDTWVVMMLC